MEVRRHTAVAWLVAVTVIVAGGVAASELHWARSRPDEKATVTGVGNFGRVSPRLYRGAQPNHAGLRALKAMGVETVVSFTLATDSTSAEARDVRALGMSYVSIPWSAWHEPTPEQVAMFLDVLDGHPERTVFLHCWQGADRTGVMVAVYRIAHDHWSAAAAIDEMRAFHYHPLFQPHLRRFVESFAAATTFSLAG